MAMGGVASPTATAAKTGELKGGGEQEEEEGMMAVARDEEEVGATEPWPKSDPLVDIYMETGGPLQTRASTLMQGPAASPIRRGIASRLRHAPLRIFIPGPPACVSLLVDYLRLWAMAASLEVSGGAPPSPCPLPNPPHVPRFLVGDWEAFLSLLGLREWVEGIRVRTCCGVYVCKCRCVFVLGRILTCKTIHPTNQLKQTDATALLPLGRGGGRRAPVPR